MAAVVIGQITFQGEIIGNQFRKNGVIAAGGWDPGDYIRERLLTVTDDLRTCAAGS